MSHFSIHKNSCKLYHLFYSRSSLAKKDVTHPTLEVAKAINDFNLDLIKVIKSNGNVFYSPASIAMAFAMVSAGAKGETREQLLQTFQLNRLDNVNEAFGKLMSCLNPENRPENDKKSFELDIANKILVEKSYPIEKDFTDTVKNVFKASVENIDFKTKSGKVTDDINEWVKKQTHGKIDKVFGEPVPDETKLVIVNAIYFNGKWAEKVDPRNTKKDTFRGTKQESSVDFMFIESWIVSMKFGSNSRLLALPYDGYASMVILLPDDGVDLEELVMKLDIQELEDGIQNLFKKSECGGSEHGENTMLYLPKFKLETEYDLIKIMKQLGVSDLFGESADLSGISGKNDDDRLYVCDARHKALVEVDEEGTTAAAVTSMVMACCSFIPSRPLVIRVDRPFLFFIRDHSTNVNLFTGKIDQL